jgi:spore maturation protein SpmA
LNPSSIILPTLISSTIATAVGVILTKIFCNKKSTQGAVRSAVARGALTLSSKGKKQ